MIMSFWPTSFTEDNNNRKKKKHHVSRAKQREHTHGFLEETRDKKSGGIFLLPLFCATGSSFLSAKLRLKEYLKSGCDIQWRYVSALGKGNRAAGAF